MAELRLTVEDARRIGIALGIDWDGAKFDPDEFRSGIEFELESLHRDPARVTDEDELRAFQTALARLRETPDFYARAERTAAELRAYSESL